VSAHQGFGAPLVVLAHHKPRLKMVTKLVAGLALVGAAAASQVAGVKTVLEPIPMSDVALAGDWKDKEQRNQEVLLSLNHSEWACHFTSTANLTKCDPTAISHWETFVKNLTHPTEFTMALGFIGAGNDVRPPTNVTVAACKSFCSTSATCKAVSFMISEVTFCPQFSHVSPP
jgi:hypothetical protein